MSEHVDRHIDHIAWLRWSILPPYCSNEDEDERSVDDYLNFFRRVGRQALASTDEYINAIRAFAGSPAKGELFDQLLRSRRSFILAFPFCTDELQGAPQEEMESYRNAMLTSYQRDVAIGKLLTMLVDYRDTAEKIFSCLD